ncbi:ABC transporter permease [Granulicoccus sp. GXG6511]|uniref:ABC transporter permease n=1 Tax=Granulicoccus sp. GXG6511 TaxID=3381351 RepID=UPI003D7DC821
MADQLLTGATPRALVPRLGGMVVGLLAVAGYALLTPVLAPAGWLEVDLTLAREAPSVAHWFGTDNAGRDLFVRVAQGLRVSLVIAVVCALASTVIGIAVGTVAAMVGGLVDGVLMRITDATNALPHLLLGIVIVAFFPGSLPAIIASIALTHWPQVARIVRSVAVTARRSEFVDAAYLAGARRRDVLARHILPAVSGQATVAVVLLLPHAIWHESTLSFLGLGLSPDRASLGTLLAIARGEMLIGAWWTLVFPAAALVLATLAASGLAGWLQRHHAPVVEGRVA